MALTIRLRQQGRTNRRFYRLVVTDARNPREGRYLEAIGWYDPCATNEDNILCVKPDRAQHWLDNGATLTDSAESLIARAAPQVIKHMREKKLAHKQKQTAKRRESRRAKAKK